jgi:hypothetical protein
MQNQTKTEEEQVRERVEFVEFQYGLWDLVSRLGTALSSLVVFGGVLYLAGGLHARAYFFGFHASWLVWELPGNSFPFRVLLQVVIFISSIATGAALIRWAESKKWSWVGKLISRHEPHKESTVGIFLLNLSFALASLILILLRFLPFNFPWMITHPYWASVLSVLLAPVFVAWAAFFVLAPSKNDILNFFTRYLLFPVVALLSILVFSFLRPYIERYYDFYVCVGNIFRNGGWTQGSG